MIMTDDDNDEDDDGDNDNDNDQSIFKLFPPNFAWVISSRQG